MKELLDNLIECLFDKGFKETEVLSHKIIFINGNNDSIYILDQGIDGIEVWIKKESGDWIRLDFILEYYLSGNTELTRQYSAALKSKDKAQFYYSDFLNRYYNKIFDSSILKYSDWMLNNMQKIKEISENINEI